MTLNINGGLFGPGATEPLDGPGAANGGSASPFSATSVARFEDAMRAAQGLDPALGQGVQVAQVQAPGSVTDVTPPVVTAPLDPARNTGAADGATAPDPQAAADRALRGLDLDPVQNATPAPATDPGPGTTILSGLERLRGAFDSQITSIHERSTGTAMDVTTMMNIQAEVVQYSVLVDVTSKLAGKSTQALDSLMKGQ